jgi:DNA polymerase (family X)
VNLFCTPANDWGASLVLRTGSHSHLSDLQQLAVRDKLELPWMSPDVKSGLIARENQVYGKLGLDFIEPELREGRGEVQAAASGTLPSLVKLADLQGDLHMHTTASDGANSISEMAHAARRKGYHYIAITDHSQSLKITNGLSEKRLLEHIEKIDAFNTRQNAIVVLKSAEVDILQDGTLDYSNAVLKELDFTICSIHSRFALNNEQQTERIIRAMDNRYFNILGHPTGRLLLKREGYELDIDRLITHAKSTGCYFEINSSPDRLDLSDEHARLAKEAGIQIAINTDAHSIAELNFMEAGINQARRAWLEPRDVLNALPLEKLMARFRR